MKKVPLLYSILQVKTKEQFAYRLMVMPALLVLIGIMYPFLVGVYTSMTDQTLYSGQANFVFLKNYLDNFSDSTFLVSLKNTLAYAAMAIAMQIPLGVLAALLLDSKSHLQKFMRTVLVFPLLIPPVVSSLMWKTMMSTNSGVLNFFLECFGLEKSAWLADINTVLFSLVLIDTWVYLPFTAIILLSGLQSLPLDILEAAQVDGASPVKVFFRIRLPWLKPYLLLASLFRVCDSLKAFELIYSTTRGGPLNASRTLNILAYEEAFRWSNTGTSLSIIFTLWIIAFLISNFLMKQWNKSAIQ